MGRDSDPALQRLVELGEAKPGLKSVAVAHEDAPGGGQRRVLIAGLGKRDESDAFRFGLMGMRERVEALRGTFAAGPLGRSAWLVECRLPKGST